MSCWWTKGQLEIKKHGGGMMMLITVLGRSVTERFEVGKRN